MRLLALFLGNLQGPACVIQPAIARQIIKTCHRNLPFSKKKAGNYVFIASEGKEEDRKQREVEPGRSQEPALGQLARGLPNLRALSAQAPLLADFLACASRPSTSRFGWEEVLFSPSWLQSIPVGRKGVGGGES